MRFKAKLAPEQVSLFYSLIVPMTKLGSGGAGGGDGDHVNSSNTGPAFSRNGGTILYLDSDHLRLSCKGRTADTDGMTCFAELSADSSSSTSIFLDRRIESAAPNNAIVMELDLAQLRMALKSVMSDSSSRDSNNTSGSIGALGSGSLLLDAQYTVLKLAKRQNIPCLCIDACTSSSGMGIGVGAAIQVHHAIPVRILRHSEMHHYMPPPIRLPDVQLELGQAHCKNLRIIVDRLKHLSPILYLEGNMTGELTIRCRHSDYGGASIQTYLSKLKPRFENCQAGGTDDSNNNRTSTGPSTSVSTRVKVDAKKLSTSLQWQQNASSSSYHSSSSHSNMVLSALLCLVENEMLVVHVNLNPDNVGFFTYYVPVHFLSDDPCEDD